MRDRHLQPRSDPEPRRDLPPFSDPDRAVPMARIFTADALNLDDLAEAVRSLLGATSLPRTDLPTRPKPELLSLPRRVTHVVEATETP